MVAVGGVTPRPPHPLTTSLDIPFLSKYFPANTTSSVVTGTPSLTSTSLLSVMFVLLSTEHVLSSRVQPKTS